MKDTGVNLARKSGPRRSRSRGTAAGEPAEEAPLARLAHLCHHLLALVAGVAWFVMREVRTSALQAEFSRASTAS
jgi:hypothetical protein